MHNLTDYSLNFNKDNLFDENKVNLSLEKAGFYDTTHIFPIASLQFELTSHCNMFCKHCYNNSGEFNKIADKMTPQKWLDFADYLVKKGGIFECILSGGEPFLLGDTLFELMESLNRCNTIFMMLTNGYLLTKKNIRFLEKYKYHWFQISIDGATADYHDSFRNKQGSWAKAVNGAKLVSQSNIPLKIAHCVTPYNINDIDGMCKLAYSLGAKSIIVGEISFSGRAALNKDLLLSPDQKKMLHDKVLNNAERYKGIMRIKTTNSIISGLQRHKQKPNSTAVIRPNGDIRIDGMAPFVIGNILKDDFETIWKEKVFSAWSSHDIINYIENFDENDKNNSYINYVDKDTYL